MQMINLIHKKIWTSIYLKSKSEQESTFIMNGMKPFSLKFYTALCNIWDYVFKIKPKKILHCVLMPALWEYGRGTYSRARCSH